MRAKIRFLLLNASTAGLLLLCLAGCSARPHGPESPSAAAVGAVPPAPGFPQNPHAGQPFDVVSRESLLTILAFRGGALAKVGHNHVIASHDVSGAFYVPDDVAQTTFELRIPVAQLTIDEPELRAKEGPDFPTDVSDSAKEGTRRNMLSEALLSGAQYPEITLVSQHIETTTPGSQVRAEVQMSVRGQIHTVSVPVSYSRVAGELTVSGELPLAQTALGLTPFSALLGTLAVQDEMRVRFRIVAHRAQTSSAARSQLSSCSNSSSVPSGDSISALLPASSPRGNSSENCVPWPRS
jgi:polyisoprenoid-binding protein YceI